VSKKVVSYETLALGARSNGPYKSGAKRFDPSVRPECGSRDGSRKVVGVLFLHVRDLFRFEGISVCHRAARMGNGGPSNPDLQLLHRICQLPDRFISFARFPN